MATTSLQAKVQIRDNKYVVIYYRNQRFKTGISIENPNEFSKGKLTAKYSGPEDYKELNTLLNQQLLFVNNLISEARVKRVDSLEYINAHLAIEERKLKKLRVTNNTSLPEAFEQYILVKKNKSKHIKKERSFNRYKSELSRLKDYHAVCPTKLSDIDDGWVFDFTRWLATPQKKTFQIYDKKKERTYTATKTISQTNSTIKRFLQDIITFLNFLQVGEPGLVFPISEMTDHMNELKSPKNDPETVVALSPKQLEAYTAYQPRDEKYEQLTYDLYLFCVHTGLRYSDATTLYDIYVAEGVTIQMRAAKTRGRFAVKMNPTALRIYEKYGRDFRDKFPCNQQVNKNLRNILKRIPEFNEITKSYKFILGDLIMTPVEAHKVIKFHSSRRTFVSNVIKKGATFAHIQKYTGWTDLRTLKSYLDIFGQKDNDDAFLY